MDFILETIKSVILWLFLPIILIGLFGNLFSFIIFSRKRFNTPIFSVYFRFINIIDTFTLIFAINDFLIFKYRLNAELVSEFLCHTFYYFNYSTAPSSNWILVIISIDRYMNIKLFNPFH